jgi:phosphatidylserine synthase
MIYTLEPSPATWKAGNIFLYIVALCIYVPITFFPSTVDEYQLPIKLGLPLSTGLALVCTLQHLTMETIKTPQQMHVSIFTTIMMFVVFGLISNMYGKKIHNV